MACTHLSVRDKADFGRTATNIDIEKVLLLFLCRLRHHQQTLNVIVIDDLCLFVARYYLDVDACFLSDVFQDLSTIGRVAQSGSSASAIGYHIIYYKKLAIGLDHAQELFLTFLTYLSVFKDINTEAQREAHELKFLEKQGSIVLRCNTLDEQSGSIRADIYCCDVAALIILSYHLNIVYIVLPVIGTSYGHPSCHTLQSSSPRL